MEGNELVTQVINTIVEALNLNHLDKGTIRPETPLVHEGLGLDSVDVLEVIVAIEQRFKVKVPDAQTAKKNFATIGSIADFVKTHAGSA